MRRWLGATLAVGAFVGLMAGMEAYCMDCSIGFEQLMLVVLACVVFGLVGLKTGMSRK